MPTLLTTEWEMENKDYSLLAKVSVISLKSAYYKIQHKIL